jgi:hypothetical protein
LKILNHHDEDMHACPHLKVHTVSSFTTLNLLRMNWPVRNPCMHASHPYLSCFFHEKYYICFQFVFLQIEYIGRMMKIFFFFEDMDN